MPTLKYLMENGAIVLLTSHLVGAPRPPGAPDASPCAITLPARALHPTAPQGTLAPPAPLSPCHPHHVWYR